MWRVRSRGLMSRRYSLLALAQLLVWTALTSAAPPPQPPPPNDAVSLATSWMEALRASDTAKLAKYTQLPFRLACSDTGAQCFASPKTNKPCPGVSRKGAEFTSQISCLLQNKLLSGELRSTHELTYKLLDSAKIPASLQRAAEKSLAVVETGIDGDGVTYTFYVVIERASQADGLAVVSVLIISDFHA